VKWFAVDYDDRLADKVSSYSFPNNRVLTIDSSQIVHVSTQEIKHRTTSIKSTGSTWQGYSSRSIEFDIDGNTVNYIVYLPDNQHLTDTIKKQIVAYLKRSRATAANIRIYASVARHCSNDQQTTTQQ